MKILLLLVGLGYACQLWSAFIAGKAQGNVAKRIIQASMVWLPLVLFAALAAFTRRDWSLLALVIVAVYAWMAYRQRKRRMRP